MAKQTMLEKANEARVETARVADITEEQLDILIAFLESRIRHSQFAVGTGKTRANVNAAVGAWVRAAVYKGRIKIVRAGK